MSEAISEERLNDYVDGLLSASETAEVEHHLEVSAAARHTVEFLRSLRQRAAELPASIPPERDLWPHIRERMAPAPLASIDGTAPADTAPAEHRWWLSLNGVQWAALATAAMLLMAISSALTAWVVGIPVSEVPPPGSSVEAAAPTGVALETAPAAEAAYAVEIEQLLWVLYENRDTLDPDTVTTIETNLRVIDRAIRNAREALEDDPQNAGLTRMLTSSYRRKLQLLQRASRIIELS